MITRRRGRGMNAAEELPLDVETVDMPERDRNGSDSLEMFTASNPGSTGMELDDLFEFGDLGWSDRDAIDFDKALAEFDAYDIKDQHSGIEVSIAACNGRLSPDLQVKNRKHPVSHVSNKNAIAARLNRLKKKEYVSNLERKVGILSTQNGTLKQENCQLTKRVEELEDETRTATPTIMTTLCPGSRQRCCLTRLWDERLSERLYLLGSMWICCCWKVTRWTSSCRLGLVFLCKGSTGIKWYSDFSFSCTTREAWKPAKRPFSTRVLDRAALLKPGVNVYRPLPYVCNMR